MLAVRENAADAYKRLISVSSMIFKTAEVAAYHRKFR